MKTIDEYPEQEAEPRSTGVGLQDVVRMLFKHKWKLITCALLSIGGAAYVYFSHVPEYESTSKIFVRYVEEISNVDQSANGGRMSEGVDSVISAEVEIMRSWDLANEVAEQVTPEAILGKTEAPTRGAAAAKFLSGLEVEVPRGTRVISVTYRHPDPSVAVKGLTALIGLYQQKHVDIHRAKKSREISRSRKTAMMASISQLSEQIEQLKADNGISSLPDAAAGLNRRSDEVREEADKAKADMQEQIARIAELKRLGLIVESDPSKPAAAPDQEKPANAPGTPDSAERAAHLEYQLVMKRLNQLQDDQIRLLNGFRAEHPDVKQNREDIQAWEAKRAKLEREHPSLVQAGPRVVEGSSAPSAVDATAETIRLATLTARANFLQKRQDALKEEFKQFSIVSKRIHELERERDLQTEGMKQFAGNFQRTEFESPLKADDYDNIVIVQSSSPPSLALNKLMKTVAGIGLGGIIAALAFVVLLELGVNRTLKRPLEIETRLGVPLMMSIPKIRNADRLLLGGGRKVKSAKGTLAAGVEPWSAGHFIRPFAEAMRDRLVLHFEQIGLTRKPKLVGIASYSKGAGVSTVASGIAATLSETGDGKVLLVDMNAKHAEVHPFFQGKHAASLNEALEGGASKLESAAENLYLAAASTDGGGRGQLFPKRFYDMLPNFQASDFDYIIFDMPPMDESSLTLAMSGFMDKLLLVVEGEKDNREAVKRASAELIRARAKLSGVMNKTRTFGPKWLQEA